MNISYDYYRIFYYVATYGSFTQAARMLLNNQPNLTRAIKNLEASLGCTLFLRSNQGVTLTSEGETLYAHIAPAFDHIQAGEEEISAHKGLQKGIVSIGVTEISLRCFLLPILNDYRQQYPGIRIKISNLSTPQTLSALKSGLVDCAVVTTPLSNPSELRYKKVKEFQEVAVCGEALYRQFAKVPSSLRELTECPIVSLSKGGSTHRFYTELFANHHLPFSADIAVATADQILPIVKHNLGVGFVPEQFLEEESGGIVSIPLAEPIPKREIHVATRKGYTPSLAAKELEKMMMSSACI